MKYYFTGSTKKLSIDGGRYKLINNILDSIGFKPLNYIHFPNESVEKTRYVKLISSKKLSVYELQTSLIDQADVLIADVTRESITVGYQIEYAIRKKIPVLVLKDKGSEKSIPVMLTDDHFGLLTVAEYRDDHDIINILKNFKQNVISEKIKFNFFLNVSTHNYLTKRAAKEGRNKSTILREIILDEMKRNPL